MRVSAIICLIGVLVGVSLTTANAQSSTCRKLERQLAAVSTGNRAKPSRKYLQYERAVRQQRIQLSKTRRIARRNGCSSRSNNRAGRCGRLNSSMRKMRRNLANLERTRDRLRPGRRNAGAQRHKILKKMGRRGCLERDVRQAEIQRPKRERSGRRSLIEQIFGVRTYRDDGRREDDGAYRGRAGYGTYRTMCVRTCDGYYFPISFSTTTDRFDNDEAVCQAMCPGSEVNLYFHAMPSQSPEQMISYRQDTDYAKQPFAFQYRKSVNPECSCRFAQARGLEEIAGSTKASSDDGAPVKRETYARIGLPVYREDPYLDPETLSNLTGNLTGKDLVTLGTPSDPDPNVKMAGAGKNKRIRIVGPAFFPVQ